MRERMVRALRFPSPSFLTSSLGEDMDFIGGRRLLKKRPSQNDKKDHNVNLRNQKTLLKSKTLSVSIHCDPSAVYQFASNLENLPHWAMTFCRSVKKWSDEWLIETPQGPVKIRMVAKNDLGILDHYVVPAPGVEVFVPMRVVQNNEGSEVIFTLFKRADISDEQFKQDIRWVKEDLKSLKRIMEKKDHAGR